jgi:hypothetical protein
VYAKRIVDLIVATSAGARPGDLYECHQIVNNSGVKKAKTAQVQEIKKQRVPYFLRVDYSRLRALAS